MRSFILLFLALSCVLRSGAQEFMVSETSYYIADRQRSIPVAAYFPAEGKSIRGYLLFSHGYDYNRGSAYKDYTYLTEGLAQNGFVVISIQHENSDDPLLAMEGEFTVTRMPNWERGAQNIEDIRAIFNAREKQMHADNTVLIGHSNGGDMSVLYGLRYPEKIAKIITLDHRRMPIPLTNRPRYYSLRGSDYPAEQGVLPDEQERESFGITIIQLTDIGHSDMDDKGSLEQKQLLLEYLLRFLEE